MTPLGWLGRKTSTQTNTELWASKWSFGGGYLGVVTLFCWLISWSVCLSDIVTQIICTVFVRFPWNFTEISSKMSSSISAPCEIIFGHMLTAKPVWSGPLLSAKKIIRHYRCNNWEQMPRPRGYKTFFMLNSAEHENFSANKYENANHSWYFHIY